MRTATRVALMLTGTAILVVAMTTPGVRADRAPADRNQLAAMSRGQHARPQSRPDRIEYVQATAVKAMATAIAHLPGAPDVANAGHGAWVESELAAAIDATASKSVAPRGCDGDTFAVQQRNASDGGRGPVADDGERDTCRKENAPRTRTRQAAIGDLDLSQMRSPEPEPVVLKFEAVIRIDLAGLRW